MATGSLLSGDDEISPVWEGHCEDVLSLKSTTVSHPNLKANSNAKITCASGSSYTHVDSVNTKYSVKA
jgi:hypothetical protein